MSNDPSEAPGFSRRHFLRETLLGAGAVGALGLGVKPAEAANEGLYPATADAAKVSFDFTKQSGALGADKVVDSACQFCNSLCRLKVHLKEGRIIDVLGEPADPVQAGGLCVKGEQLMTQLVYNRFRLRTPLRRVAGEKGSPDSQFEPCSWDDALDMVAAKLLALRDAGEAHCAANKTSGRLARGVGSLAGRFFTLLGSPNDTDVGPVCNDSGGNALAWTFGLGNFTNGYGKDESTGKEDLGGAKMFLFFGTNQAETHPVTFSYLLRSRARTGAKLVVVRPPPSPPRRGPAPRPRGGRRPRPGSPTAWARSRPARRCCSSPTRCSTACPRASSCAPRRAGPSGGSDWTRRARPLSAWRPCPRGPRPTCRPTPRRGRCWSAPPPRPRSPPRSRSAWRRTAAQRW